MSARSIDPSTVDPSGAMRVAPTTSLLVPFVKPTQMSTEPELLAPFESQPVGVTLPRMQGCASAVKPSANTTGSPLAPGDPLASGDPLGPTLADGVGSAVATAVAVGDGVVSTWLTPGRTKTPASTSPLSSARSPSARKPRMATAPRPARRSVGSCQSS